MKKAVLLIVPVMLFLASCNHTNKEETSATEKSRIEFTDHVFDFGSIEYGSDGRCYFTFKNTSDNDLLINVVRTSCGCTRPEWPREPISSGETGRIGITYDTERQGKFHKNITVFSNAENSPVKLFIKGTVEPALN